VLNAQVRVVFETRKKGATSRTAEATGWYRTKRRPTKSA
jgi:hypothetical protein